jgi:hypothetical protein
MCPEPAPRTVEAKFRILKRLREEARELLD